MLRRALEMSAKQEEIDRQEEEKLLRETLASSVQQTQLKPSHSQEQSEIEEAMRRSTLS